MKLTKLILLGVGAMALVLLPRRSSPKSDRPNPKATPTTSNPQTQTLGDDSKDSTAS